MTINTDKVKQALAALQLEKQAQLERLQFAAEAKLRLNENIKSEN